MFYYFCIYNVLYNLNSYSILILYMKPNTSVFLYNPTNSPGLPSYLDRHFITYLIILYCYF